MRLWSLESSALSQILALAVVILFSNAVGARTFDLSGDLIGELALASSLESDTLSDVARAYDQGYMEMRWANPTIDPWLPGEEAEIIVPSLYVLPEAAQQGISLL